MNISEEEKKKEEEERKKNKERKMEAMMKKLEELEELIEIKEVHVLVHVVRQEKAANEEKEEDQEGRLIRKYYPYGELFTVDIERGCVLTQCPCNPLIEDEGCGSMVAVDNDRVFVLGGLPPEYYTSYFLDDERTRNQKHTKCYYQLEYSSEHATLHIHDKVSFLDLPPLNHHTDVKWCQGPLLPTNDAYVTCVAFKNKIYAFGRSENFLEVLDACKWRALLPPKDLFPLILTDREMVQVSSPVLADPSNNRIIIYLRKMSAVYAYYPDVDHWECVAHKVDILWSPGTVALLENVIYIHIPDSYNKPFAAFDLTSKQWLNKVVFSKLFEDHYNVITCEFEALLHLGNTTLCLAASSAYKEEKMGKKTQEKTRLVFARFQVNHTPGSDVAFLTAISYDKCSLPFPCLSTAHFLPYEV